MGRGSSKRKRNQVKHQQKSTPSISATSKSIDTNIEEAMYNAMVRKELYFEEQKENKRQQLLDKIGRKDYSHLHPFKAWWCEWGNMFVQIWNMRKLRKSDMHELTFTKALMKAPLVMMMKICGTITQLIGIGYIAVGLLQLLNWHNWKWVHAIFENVTATSWIFDIAWMIFGFMVGLFAMFIKFARWELEQSKDEGYLVGILSIVISVLLCIMFP